jgi:transcriptional regulator with XRE-family HTH domain
MVGDDSFAAVLRAARHGAGLTLEELSESSGVSVRALSDMERGRALGPQRRTVVLIAGALKLEGARRDEFVALAKAGRTRSAYFANAPGLCEPPGSVGDFTGRAAELAWISRLVDALEEPTDRSSAAVISGGAGLGKTTLVVRAAHQLRDRFPDGVYFVDALGMSQRPVGSDEILARVLRALGVRDQQIPQDPAERAGRYRQLLRERRVLVIVDDAAPTSSARPLPRPHSDTVSPAVQASPTRQPTAPTSRCWSTSPRSFPTPAPTCTFRPTNSVRSSPLTCLPPPRRREPWDEPPPASQGSLGGPALVIDDRPLSEWRLCWVSGCATLATPACRPLGGFVSDFDTVLERLLLDPQFKSALASDPTRTLAGYQLSDQERQILLTDMAGASGTQSLVEDRISKSSMFGLLSSLSGGLVNVAEYEEVARGGLDTGPEAVAEYEEISLGGPDTDGDAVAFKEVDPMPAPHDADLPGTGPDGDSPQGGPSPHMQGGPDTGPEAVAEYEEISLGGPDTDGDAVALKEVDPMPVPHEADTPGPATPPGADSPQGGPSPHMLGDPTTPSSQGGELRVGPAEDKVSPAELKIATADLHVVIPPDLPSS